MSLVDIRVAKTRIAAIRTPSVWGVTVEVIVVATATMQLARIVVGTAAATALVLIVADPSVATTAPPVATRARTVRIRHVATATIVMIAVLIVVATARTSLALIAMLAIAGQIVRKLHAVIVAGIAVATATTPIVVLVAQTPVTAAPTARTPLALIGPMADIAAMTVPIRLGLTKAGAVTTVHAARRAPALERLQPTTAALAGRSKTSVATDGTTRHPPHPLIAKTTKT